MGFEMYLIGDEVGWYDTSGSHMEFLDAVSPYIVLPQQIERGIYPGDGDFFADLSVLIGQWEETAHPLGLSVIPSVIPGFNNRSGWGSGFAVPRQTGADSSGTSLLEDYIKVVLPFVEPDHRMIMITSWNEWHEDTQIEPTVFAPLTFQDISEGGSDHTWNYGYEGYGFANLEVIRSLLASELPETDFAINTVAPGRMPQKMEMYPNPVHDILHIGTEKSGTYLIELRDINGRLLHQKQWEGTASELDLSSFQEGIYFITIRSKDVVVTRKIVKL